MAYTEVLTGHGLTVTQWESEMFQEYLGQVWWSNLMGTGQNAIIQVKDNLTKSAGDTIRFGIRSQLLGGHVVGNNKGIGNEGRVEFYEERITIDNDRQLVKFEDVPMSSQRVMFSVLNEGREALIEKAKYQLEDDITETLAGDNSAGRVRGRYLYGAADSNWNATHATALQNVDNTSDQLTTDMISIAKRKALIPVNATAKMRPTRIKNGKNVEEWFIFTGHTYCLRDMVENDATWKNAHLNIPPQSNGSSPLFTGSWFKGAWQGVLIYENDRLPLISSTIQVGRNFLLGAQAAGIAWGQRSKFGEEMSDVGHDVTFELHEIRGLEKFVFDRNTVDSSITNEDNGVVHVFAAAVAD